MSDAGFLYVQTPVMLSLSMSQLASFDVFLKLDNLQPSGSFKLRGISNLCLKAIKERHCSRLYCASGGNAGLAVAYVCQKLNVPCTIVLPNSTPHVAADKLHQLGADVKFHGTVWDEANELVLELSQKSGGEYVHPFDHPDVWQGNESIIMEAAEQLQRKPDVVVTCVGGGGLLNGVLQGLSAVGWEDVPVVAMETVGADSLNQSLKAGKIVTLPGINSIAITLGACTISARTFDLVTGGRYKVISHVIPDSEAVRACLMFADHQRFLVEPACGASLSAVYSGVIQHLQGEGQLPKDISSVLIEVCGGSLVSLDLLHEWKQRFNL